MIRLIVLLTLFISSAFANVILNAPNSFIKGELYVFSIEARGSSVEFPKIDKIDGNIVSEVGSSSSTNIINGKITRSIKKSFSLLAKDEFTIPSFTFKVDGKEFFSNEKLVKVHIPKKTRSSLFDLSLKSNKNELFVGEAFELKLVFKFRRDTQIVDLNLQAPSFDGFWHKQLDDSKKYYEGNFEVQELSFLLFPLRSGNLKIDPVFVNASIVDMNRNFNSFFSTPTKNIRIYSNDLKFNINALPNGVNLIGDFNIETLVDKTKVKANEAVSFKIKISGHGNIEDIEDIKLANMDATVYENKASIDAKYENGLYKGVYTKTFSIIPNKSLEIPPIKLLYFDKDKNEVIEKSSRKFSIELLGKEKKESIKLEKAQVKVEEKIKIVEKSSPLDKVIFFVLGMIVSILILGLYFYVIKQRENKKFNEIPLLKKIKKSQSKDDLLKVLAIYINKDENLDKLIFDLEKSDNITTIKKEIIKLLKSINFKG